MRIGSANGRRSRTVVVSTVLAAGLVALPAAGHAQEGWSSVDADAQGSRQAGALGPVAPRVNWVWDDDAYDTDGAIGGTRVATPSVLDHDGRLLFKARNRAYNDEAQNRYDLLALDPTDGSATTLLADTNDDGCAPAVAPDGSIWTFQDRNDRTEPDGFADRSAAAVVRLDPDTGEETFRYSGPGGSAPGVFGCSDGVQVAPDGTIVFRDYPTPGGNEDGDFTAWLRTFDPAGAVGWQRSYDPDDHGGREFNQPWVRLAPAGTPAAGTIYVFSTTPDPAVAAVDLDSGQVSHTTSLPGTSFNTSPVVDPGGGIVVALEDGNVGNDGFVVRVTDDGSSFDVDWQQSIAYDKSRQDGLKGAPRSLQLDDDEVVAFSDTGSHIERFRWADGTYAGATAAGWTNADGSNLTIDAAGNAYFPPLSAGRADEVALKVAGPDGGIIGELLKGAIGDANDGELFGGASLGPIASDGTLYLWGGDNNWVSITTRPSARLAGISRFDTAAQLARRTFGPGLERVYLATGTNFPDALTAGPLAALDDAPVLLAAPTLLPPETAAALEELRPQEVVAIGGEAAISNAVLAEAAAEAGDAATDRVFGANRFGTAAAVADQLPASDVVYIGTGANYPDALAGGPATDGAPILLATRDLLPQETIASLADRTPARVVALGGQAAISDAVLAQAADAAGGASTGRLEGADRFTTALDIADEVVAGGGFAGTVYVAVGTNYPDAVAAAPAAESAGAPIVLVAPDFIPGAVADWLEDLDGLEHVVILGGEAAINTAVEAQLAALVG